MWKHTIRLLSPAEADNHAAIIQQVHQLSLARAQDILGKSNIINMVEFI